MHSPMSISVKGDRSIKMGLAQFSREEIVPVPYSIYTCPLFCSMQPRREGGIRMKTERVTLTKIEGFPNLGSHS